MLIAVTREVPSSFIDRERAHLVREPIAPTRAVSQNARKKEELDVLGCNIRRIPSALGLPDFMQASGSTLSPSPYLVASTRSCRDRGRG